MNNYTEHKSARLSPTEGAPRVHVGLDVHKYMVAVAIAYRGSKTNPMAVENRGTMPNRPNAVVKLTSALHQEFGESSHFVYLAGACGFVIWSQLRDLGLSCEAMAPTLIPKKPGEQV